MKAGLLILPFLAFVIAGIGMAVDAAYPQSSIITAISWALSAAMLVMWMVLDWDSLRRVFSRKGAKFGLSSGLVIVLGIAVIVGVASLSVRSRFNKSVDLTRDSLNTLSDQSLKMIDNVNKSDDQVRLDGFFLDEPVKAKFADLIRLYQEAGADFEITYVNPSENPLRSKAEKLSSNNTVIFRHGENEKRITVFTEEKITNALVNVLRKQAKKLYFTVGHGEGNISGEEADGYALMATILDTFRYTIEPLNLLEQAKVPDDAAAIIVASPRYDFKEEEIRFLDDYLSRGGSLMVIVGALNPIERFNKLLADYGLQFDDNVLLMNEAVAQVQTPDVALVTEFDEFHAITRDFGKQGGVVLTMRLTRSVKTMEDNLQKMKVEAIGKTAQLMASVDNVKTVEDAKGRTYDPKMIESFPVLAVAYGQPLAKPTAKVDTGPQDAKTDVHPKTAATPDKSRQTRIVAIGATDFGNNASVSEDMANRDMFTNVVNYLSQDEDYISIAPKDPTKSELNIESGFAMVVLLLLFVYPFTFLGGGIIYWMTRRNA